MEQFNQDGLCALSVEEEKGINGGSIPPELVKKLLKKGLWGYVAVTIIENWDDLKEGFTEGWNDAGK